MTRTFRRPAAQGLAHFEVANFIEAHYSEAIKLNALAQMVHVSPSYLSRMFSRRMGMGIIDYLHHIRIEEACRILRHADEPISRVAMLVGYAEIAYFARRFRRDVGLCARQYRLRNRGDFSPDFSSRRGGANPAWGGRPEKTAPKRFFQVHFSPKSGEKCRLAVHLQQTPFREQEREVF
ncbi:MAG: helix-turn-helix transcriptional regulator [Verrucomicrobia bacterium]|nr:helix-turn-helix transcriptional regulator [Verrucomicrobiota bacterium]